MIRISAHRDGFRRCGMAHPKEPAEYPDGTFSDEQIAVLTAEPMLTVQVVEQKEMTVPDYKALLDEMNVDYPAGAKKSELKTILEKAKADREKKAE